MIAYIVYSLKESCVHISFSTIGFGILQGVLWAGGMIFVFLALEKGVEVAKLAPIYNINTLIAVFLGFLLLHEIPTPEERIKIIIGAILITLGGILISR